METGSEGLSFAGSAWLFQPSYALNLARYKIELPDAYERLILDAIDGDKRLFIRNDELDAAWKIFTPVLQELEEKKISPELYPYGSRGPIGAHYLAAKYNVRWGDMSSDNATSKS